LHSAKIGQPISPAQGQRSPESAAKIPAFVSVGKDLVEESAKYPNDEHNGAQDFYDDDF
jgi:hypothetical protein